MDCNECEGAGRLHYGSMNDPDGVSLRCETCNGTGRRELEFGDLDGLQVRVIGTKFVGTCHVWVTGTATVIDENDVEKFDLTFEQLELVE